MTQVPARYPASAFDIFNVYFEQIYDPTMHVLFTFDGRIDDAILKISTKRLISSNPYLGTGFIEVDGISVWEEIPKDRWEGAFVHVTSGDPLGSSSDRIPPPLDVRSGPQVRVILTRCKEGDHVCITCHHGFCDATGAMTLGKELFAIYRGIIDDPDYFPPETGTYDRTTDRILALYSSEERRRAVKEDEPFIDLWHFPVEDIGRGQPTIAWRTLSPERLELIKRFGRRYDATVNDLLIAAFFLAFKKVRDDPSDSGNPRSILTSADMRRLLKDQEEIPPMNLSVAFLVSLTIVEEAGPEEIIAQITAVTNRRKTGCLGPSCITFYEGILAGGMSSVRAFFDEMIKRYQSSGQKNPVFSNLGIIDPNDYLPVPGKDGCQLDLMNFQFIPCVCWPYGFLVTASTFRGQLTLMTAYEEGPYSTVTVERFLKYMDEFLP
ncbi:condensation protein [Methanocalculus sp.]|uniref:condensation protein n=2 Tax=Methanocalculus sp. TaxID=2004547 RepID=UPI0027214B40|nr:condensation protein [Methanocalculus sp.]MDO8840876.1 condensation protein [Methanocalculus sp.]